MNIALQIAANLAIVSEPFLPFTAAKLRTMLCLVHLPWHKRWRRRIVSPRDENRQARIAFPKSRRR